MRIQSLIFNPELSDRIIETGQERLKAFFDLGASAQEAAVSLQKMGLAMATGQTINAAPYTSALLLESTPQCADHAIMQMQQAFTPKIGGFNFSGFWVDYFESQQWKRSKGKQARFVKVRVRTVL